MKKLIPVLGLTALTVAFSFSQAKDFPKLAGPYLGQKPPGTTPEVFAPGIVSTGSHEFSCCFSPDGNEFYFTRRHPGLNETVIMVSQRVAGVWAEPDVAPFVDKQFSFEPWVTPDNKRLYFQSGRPIPGQAGPPMNVLYVERQGDGWSLPKNPGAPFNPAQAMHISSTTDGTIYTTDISGGPGSECLAVMKKGNGEYVKLEKLGLPLNKERPSMHPYISPDESYLIFTVRRPTEKINSVLFISFKTPEGGWSEPQLIDLGMKAGLPFVSPDGQVLFFTGGEQGKSDIYWVSAGIIEELRPKRALPEAPSAAAPDRWEKARTFILGKMKKEGLPSIAVAVARDGKIIWEEAWGMANIEKGIPATPQTMYSLASTTKPITATGLMVLVERGLVDLDKPANLYLGAGRLTGYRPEEATVRRLLAHTAGLPLHWNLIFEDEEAARPDMDESIRRYGILVAPPGETFSYSNFGYGIIEHIISRASKRSFADFLKSEVFDPLGLTRTAVLAAPGPVADVALRYGRQGKPYPFFDFDHRGASAVYSSAHDLVRFGMFHLQNRLPDQKQVLSAKRVLAMQQERDPKVPGSVMAMGWASVERSGYRFVSHSGGMFGVGARLTLLPENNVACVVLTNAAPTMQGTDLWDVEWEILKAVIPGFPEAPEVPARPSASDAFAPPDSLVGVWQGKVRVEAAELPAKLTVEKTGQVRLELAGQETAALTVPTPLGSLRFTGDVLIAQFMTGLKTADTARSPHILLLALKLRGEKLDGSVSAVAMNQHFCFSHWIELSRQK